MPEHYRALVVILVLAAIVFAFAKEPATAIAISKEDFVRRRNYWFLVTLAGFLSSNFFLFIVVVGVVLFYAGKHEKNRVALFFFLLLALPQVRGEIPGFAGIRYLLLVDYVKVLTVVLLLPVCLEARKLAVQNKTPTMLADKVLIAYFALIGILRFQNDTFTGFLRALPTSFIDVLIPYYAISRSLKDLKGFRDTLMSFAVAAMVSSMIGFFEYLKHWLLYTSLAGTWGVGGTSLYLLRDGLLRAISTSGQAIIFGYVIAVAIGFYTCLRPSIPSRILWLAGLMLLIAGVVSPLSKGPWLGVAVMVLTFLALSPNRMSHAAKLVVLLPVLTAALVATDMGTKIIGFLPFVGTVDEGSAAYRQQLLDTSIGVILENPLFGSKDFLQDMEDLRQGQGLIDLVNTFIVVALNTGLVGLGLFVSFFGAVMFGIFQSTRRLDESPELLVLGHSILGVLVGIMVIIFTVSPIFHVPILYWSVGAMGVAYAGIVTTMSRNTELRKKSIV